MWWKKKLDLIGQVFFLGDLAPALHELDGLEAAGVRVTSVTAGHDEIWAAALEHPDWGSARLACQRGAQKLPPLLIDISCGLTEVERERLRTSAEVPLQLTLPARDDDVLRDRKRLLRFMSAVMGADGIAGFDVHSQMIWTPDRLADELQHDAPLDIIQVHVLHVVTEDDGVWLHSHGLAEMGFLDFDVLRPAQALTEEQFDVLRAIAFQLVEDGGNGEIWPVMGADPLSLIDAATFMRSASAADRALRDPEHHTDRRVICCDPKPPGFFSRLFGAKEIRPSRLLSRGMVEGVHLVNFSTEATELTATRARETLELYSDLGREFADLECTSLAKIGYPTDSGGHGGGREHLWFEVHDFDDQGIHATLINQPHDIERMNAGDRSRHPLDSLTDWTIVTPIGQLTARNLELARSLRALRPDILEALEEKR